MHRFLRLSVLLMGLFSAVSSYAADAPQSEPADPGIEGSAIDKSAKEKSDSGGSAFAAWESKYFASGPDDVGPAIEQPIEFPHFRHAGDADKGGMEINCMYCHTYARRSAVAGIPPLQKCIGCHQSIESVRDKPRIKKLFEYWDAKKAIPWKKVHDLPDFVRFNHERHIKRFIFQQNRPVQEVCGYCHGDVKENDGGAPPESSVHGLVCKLPPKRSSGDRGRWHADRRSGILVWLAKPVADASGMVKAKGPNDCWECHK